MVEDIDQDVVSKIVYYPTNTSENEEVFKEDVFFNENNSVLVVSYMLPVSVKTGKDGN